MCTQVQQDKEIQLWPDFKPTKALMNTTGSSPQNSVNVWLVFIIQLFIGYVHIFTYTEDLTSPCDCVFVCYEGTSDSKHFEKVLVHACSKIYPSWNNVH